jgi:acyl-coenzyme A synthetase/AMP-(fatty) acid ligase
MTDADNSKDNKQWDFLLNRLAENASKEPSKLAMAFLTPGPNGGKLSKQLTYQALEQETSELAARLLESGMVKGDR